MTSVRGRLGALADILNLNFLSLIQAVQDSSISDDGNPDTKFAKKQYLDSRLQTFADVTKSAKLCHLVFRLQQLTTYTIVKRYDWRL